MLYDTKSSEIVVILPFSWILERCLDRMEEVRNHALLSLQHGRHTYLGNEAFVQSFSSITPRFITIDNLEQNYV